MSIRLVTVATFHDTVEAALVRNYLHAEGIPATLLDEATIATDWMLAGAIGGIKLQVDALHVERAEMLIARVQESKGTHDEPPVPQTAIAARETAEDLRSEAEDKAPINKLTDQLFRCAVFGLILVPLQLYALYLMASIWGSEGKVSANRRWKVWVSILLNFPIMATVAFPTMWLLDQFNRPPGSPENPRWRLHVVEERGFSVLFPHEPSIFVQVGENRHGDTRYTVWTAFARQRTYRVIITRLAMPVLKLPPAEVAKEFLADIVATEHPKVVKDEPSEFAGFIGRDFVFDFPTDRERGKIYVREREVVMVSAVGHPDEIAGEETERFFRSFRFR